MSNTNVNDKKETKILMPEQIPVPITMDIEEFRQDLYGLINKYSNLHPFVLSSILKDVYNETYTAYERVVVQDRKQYEESVNTPHVK